MSVVTPETRAYNQLSPELYRYGIINTPHSEIVTGIMRHRVFVKYETEQVTGSFKSRGAHNAIAELVRENPTVELVTASAGNHGAGIADAARRWGIPATVFVPADTPEGKKTNIRSLGGDFVQLVEVEGLFEDASDAAVQVAEQGGNAVYIPPFNSEAVMKGQGTIVSEILRDQPHIDRVFVPVGGGGLLAGSVIAAEQYPHVQIVGVQLSGNDSAEQSVRAGRRVPASKVNTLCEGSAVAMIGELPFTVLSSAYNRGKLSFVTVSAADIGQQVEAECRRREALEMHYDEHAWTHFPETTALLSLAGAHVFNAEHPELSSEQWSCVLTGSNSSDEKLDACHQAYLNQQSVGKNIASRACSIVSRPFC